MTVVIDRAVWRLRMSLPKHDRIGTVALSGNTAAQLAVHRSPPWVARIRVSQGCAQLLPEAETRALRALDSYIECGHHLGTANGGLDTGDNE